MSLSELSMTAQYNPVHSEHLTAESTYTIRNNAYSFGCTFAEVEVDIPMCKVKLLNIVNVHDCGKLIAPHWLRRRCTAVCPWASAPACRAAAVR